MTQVLGEVQHEAVNAQLAHNPSKHQLMPEYSEFWD